MRSLISSYENELCYASPEKLWTARYMLHKLACPGLLKPNSTNPSVRQQLINGSGIEESAIVVVKGCVQTAHQSS